MVAVKSSVDLTSLPLTRAGVAGAIRDLLLARGFTATAVADSTAIATPYGISAGSNTASAFDASNTTAQLFLRCLVWTGLGGVSNSLWIQFQHSTDNTFTNLGPSNTEVNASYATTPWLTSALSIRSFDSNYLTLVTNAPLKLVLYTHSTNNFYFGIAADHLGRGSSRLIGRGVVLIARVAENIPSDILPEQTWGFVGNSGDGDDMNAGAIAGIASGSTTAATPISSLVNFYYPPRANLTSGNQLIVESIPSIYVTSSALARFYGGSGPYPFMQDLSGMTVLYKNNPVFLITGPTTRSTSNLPIGRYIGDLHSDIAWGPGGLYGYLESRVVVASGSEEYEGMGGRSWCVAALTTPDPPSAVPHFRVV